MSKFYSPDNYNRTIFNDLDFKNNVNYIPSVGDYVSSNAVVTQFVGEIDNKENIQFTNTDPLQRYIVDVQNIKFCNDSSISNTGRIRAVGNDFYLESLVNSGNIKLYCNDASGSAVNVFKVNTTTIDVPATVLSFFPSVSTVSAGIELFHSIGASSWLQIGTSNANFTVNMGEMFQVSPTYCKFISATDIRCNSTLDTIFSGCNTSVALLSGLTSGKVLTIGGTASTTKLRGVLINIEQATELRGASLTSIFTTATASCSLLTGVTGTISLGNSTGIVSILGGTVNLTNATTVGCASNLSSIFANNTGSCGLLTGMVSNTLTIAGSGSTLSLASSTINLTNTNLITVANTLNSLVIGSAVSAPSAAGTTFIGAQAGYNGVSGTYNTAVGYGALYGGFTSSANVAVGYNAGMNSNFSISNFSNCVFVGNNSGGGSTLTTASYCTLLGKSTGNALTSASYCLMLGANAGTSTSYVSITNQSGVAVYGDNNMNVHGFSGASTSAINSNSSTLNLMNSPTTITFSSGATSLQIGKTGANSTSQTASNGLQYTQIMSPLKLPSLAGTGGNGWGGWVANSSAISGVGYQSVSNLQGNATGTAFTYTSGTGQMTFYATKINGLITLYWTGCAFNLASGTGAMKFLLPNELIPLGSINKSVQMTVAGVNRFTLMVVGGNELIIYHDDQGIGMYTGTSYTIKSDTISYICNTNNYGY